MASYSSHRKPARSHRSLHHRTRGQALVEFALIFPIFITMVMGIIEFSFVFNALLSIGHATRDAALMGAEAGNSTAADCVILQQIENDVTAPAVAARITRVDIYETDSNGTPVSGLTTYTRTGTTTCLLPTGGTMSVPYKLVSNGYPASPTSIRCNVLAGCPGNTPASPTVDTIAVKITYQHTWVTPLANLVSLGGTGTTLVQSNAMRMEPVL